MRPVLLTAPELRWECPSCGLQHVTRETRPHTPMHNCTKLRGLTAPFVQVHGTELKKHSTRHVVNVRGDYIGEDQGIKFDAEGTAIMSINTERADGSNDCHVFAPIAVGEYQ
jgi:hypothetical protein